MYRTLVLLSPCVLQIDKTDPEIYLSQYANCCLKFTQENWISKMRLVIVSIVIFCKINFPI